jgi:hypothetical protein
MAPELASHTRAPGITGFHDIGGVLAEFDGKLDLKDKTYSLWEVGAQVDHSLLG